MVYIAQLDKCKVMHISNNLKTSCTLETNTTPRSRLKSSEVEFEKDLGMWINSSQKSSLQCNKAAASAMRVLGMLRRTFAFNSKELFIFLYKTITYVRPLLEYCNCGVCTLLETLIPWKGCREGPQNLSQKRSF